MKVTFEIPDALFQTAKATAVERGVPFKDLLTDAIREHLRQGTAGSPVPSWMRAFGGLRALHKETKKINRILKREFEQIEEEAWR